MTDKIMHFHLKDVCLDEDNPLRITTRLYADVVDMTDNLIVDACVREARRAGVNDVYLLDRQFVLDALREKIQGTQREKFLLDKITQLESERDAAVRDMPTSCILCKRFQKKYNTCNSKKPCDRIGGVRTEWQWRGVQKEE